MTTQVDAPPLSLSSKVFFGLGAAAYGVKDQGFNYFLLFFYSQVVGLNATLVGLAIFIALCVDAISDPFVGYASDNITTRWGRRHPFMYAAVIPVGLSYFLLWSPPAEASPWFLFFYLLGLAVAIRTFITLYEVPSTALVPELSTSYDERTSILSLRYFFAWFGGIAISVIALLVLLHPTETDPTGYFNREGYGEYGALAAILISVAMLVSALGTHKRIPYLMAAPPPRKITPGVMLREIFETLSDRNFIALFCAAIFGAIATGISAGLSNYLNSFFWGFTTQQNGLINLSLVASAGIALVLAPLASRTLGKKEGALIVGFLGALLMPVPVVLRLFGVLPENGDPLLFPIILGFYVVDISLIIGAQVLMASMIADVVEESERKTARRSEGVFFAAISFTRKLTLGLGVLTVSVILGLAQFPRDAQPGEVETETVLRLGTIYAPTIIIVWLCLLACLFFYRIDRTRHEENLEAVTRARQGGANQ